MKRGFTMLLLEAFSQVQRVEQQRRSSNRVLKKKSKRLHEPIIPWEFQDPKIEVLYHIKPHFGGISPDIALTQALFLVGSLNSRYQSRSIPWHGASCFFPSLENPLHGHVLPVTEKLMKPSGNYLFQVSNFNAS